MDEIEIKPPPSIVTLDNVRILRLLRELHTRCEQGRALEHVLASSRRNQTHNTTKVPATKYRFYSSLAGSGSFSTSLTDEMKSLVSAGMFCFQFSGRGSRARDQHFGTNQPGPTSVAQEQTMDIYSIRLRFDSRRCGFYISSGRTVVFQCS